MNKLYFRGMIAAAAGFLLVPPSFGQTNVYVTVNLTAVSAPSGLFDTYLEFFEGEEGQGGAFDGPFSPLNGQVITVPDPGMYGATVYDYVLMGLYTDSSGATHVAIGSANDLNGTSWDSNFNPSGSATGFTEASIVASLESSNPNVASAMMAESKEGFLGTPIVTSSGGTAYITGFSNGENIGSLYSSNNPPTPEPSPLLILGLAPLTLLRRRRKS